jgi:Ca2+-binding EF-hand superfamily protein
MQRFDEIDTNHDGKISLDEMKVAWKDRMTQVRGYKHDGPMGGPLGRKGEHPMMGGGAHLALLDTNKDGKISWDEMSAAVKAHFDQLDANHDGFIDASEMPKGPKIGHMHHKHAPGDMPPPVADTPAPVK